MLETLITSKTRIRLLIKFFSNPSNMGYLREIADEFGESTNAVRVELNRLSEAELITSSQKGRTKVYQANTAHPLFADISRLVSNHLGLDEIAERVVAKLGDIELAFVTGDYAKGSDSGLIDLVVVGQVDVAYLDRLVSKAEQAIKRKIRYMALNRKELEDFKKAGRFTTALILYKKDLSVA